MRVMRAIINGIYICAFFSKECFHLIVDFFKFIKRHFSTGNNRLICHNNSKITRFIDLTNCRCHTINQLELIHISKESNIFVNGSVPVKENGFLLVRKVLSRYSSGFEIFFYLMETSRRPHIFYIFRRIIAEHLTRFRQRLQELTIQINFYSLPGLLIHSANFVCIN